MADYFEQIRSSFLRDPSRRLRRNKDAIVDLWEIGPILLVALFAYYLAPDHTPYANRLIPEIEGQQPRFSIVLLRVKKKNPQSGVSFMERLLSGAPEDDEYISIRRYSIAGDSLIVENTLMRY